jgi:hypothetical protein
MIGKHFGKSLTQSWAQADRDGILHFTQLAIPFLVEKAVDTIGVFSLTKDVNEVQRIKQKIDQGELVTFEQSSAHNIATLLKLYFTELPEALIPREALSELISIDLKANDQQTIIQGIRRSILKMPYLNQRLVQQISDLCNLIAYNSNKNRMSSENLVVVLLDSLFKPQNIGDEPTRSEALLVYLIDNYKIIFTREYMDEINKQKEDFQRLLQQTHIQDFAPMNNKNENNNNNDVCLEGYLSKKGEKGLVKLWKKRYFQLKNDMRLYYSEEKNTAPLGNIDLYSVSEVKSTGIAWGNERGLDIHTAGRVYQLSAPSPDLLNYWVEGLQQFLQEIKTNPAREHPFMQISSPNQPMLELEFVKIKASNDKYLSSDKSGNITANKMEANEWEVWTLERSDPTNPAKISLKNHNLKYLCGQMNGSAVANRNEAKDWEQWTLIYFKNEKDNDNPKVALRSHHNTFLTFNSVKSNVRADAKEVKDAELFLIEKLF